MGETANELRPLGGDLGEALAFENAPSFKEALLGTWHISRPNAVKVIVAGFAGLVVIVAVSLSNGTFGQTLTGYAIAAMCGLLLFCGVWFSLAVVLGTKKMMKTVRDLAPLYYTISDSGLVSESRNARVELAWPYFVGFVETRTLLLLKTAQKQYIVIPKRCVGDSEAAFVERLRAKLPPLRGLWMLP